MTEEADVRLTHLGGRALSDIEVILCLVGGNQRAAEELYALAGNSLHGFARLDREEMRRVRGVGPMMANTVSASVELARRLMVAEEIRYPIISCSQDVVAYMQPFVLGLTVEKFWVICLDRRNRVTRSSEVTVGTLGNCLVEPREVFRPAVQASAGAVVVVHNHPSGDAGPSSADMTVTKVLREAGKTLQIALHDHVIVGTKGHPSCECGYYSFRDAGLV